jgi:hypothetical protein
MCICLSSSSSPHQYLDIAEIIPVRIYFWILKTDIAYPGIAWKIAFNRISFPSKDNNFSFHLFSLAQILSIKCCKQSDLSTPTIGGSPKYFSVFVL